MENLRVEGPNTSFSCDVTDGLNWSSVHSQLSNATIAMESLHADIIDLRTSNSSISGRFEGGQIELDTSNGSISAKLGVREAQDGRQSAVKTRTANSSINLHVDATQTTKGLVMENTTKNGKIVLGTLLGPASMASSIKTSTANGKIEFNLDASQTGQPLEVNVKTTNGSIVSSMMVPKYHAFKGVAESSNGSVTVNVTEDFQGRFDLETSNNSAIVEGSNVQFDHDKKSSKRGWRGQGASEVKIFTSNNQANLRIYPTDESLASDSKMQQ
ncbi:hypothetical protein EDD21DRAFT_190320 [Dissophora ornata]|nr:hypothetical protein EDD21DRAFT_190320 [Dissophora ornata]